MCVYVLFQFYNQNKKIHVELQTKKKYSFIYSVLIVFNTDIEVSSTTMTIFNLVL